MAILNLEIDDKVYEEYKKACKWVNRDISKQTRYLIRIFIDQYKSEEKTVDDILGVK